MSVRKHLYVKRCLTYLFLAFTVFTGINDSYTPAVAARLNIVTLEYMLRLNAAISQSNISARIQVYTGSGNVSPEYFRSLSAVAKDNIDIYAAFFVVSIILLSIVYYENNCLKKNNIWKSTVF